MGGGTDHGIMPHSNILLAMGAATLLIKAERICGSDFNIWRASCSICGLGALPFSALSCHNCSQVDVWYFWIDLVGNLVHDRELLSVYGCAKQSDRRRNQGCK